VRKSNPGRDKRFFFLLQTVKTSSVNHSASRSVAAGLFPPVVKRLSFQVNQSPPSGAEVRKDDAVSILLYASKLWIKKMLTPFVVYGPG
jgi:hypothetical protein